MTGAIPGGVVASVPGRDVVFQGLGQVGADGGAVVSIYDPSSGDVSTMTHSPAGDWVPAG